MQVADKSTFIKLDRNILNWRWFHSDGTFKVWIYILIKANIKDKDFESITVKRGQFVTSLASMSKDLKMSAMQIRTALNHLKTTNEITSVSTSKYTLISVENYELYQEVITNKTTNEQQTDNKPITNEQQQYKNIKNIKNGNKRENSVFSPPTLTEIISFVSDEKLKINAEKFFHYYQARGWKGISDWKEKALEWNTTEKDKLVEDKPNYSAYDADLFEEMLNEK